MILYFPISLYRELKTIKFYKDSTYEILGDFDKFNLFSNIKQYFEFYKNISDIDKTILNNRNVIIVETLNDSETKNIDSKTIFSNKFKVIGEVSKDELDKYVDSSMLLDKLLPNKNFHKNVIHLKESFDFMNRPIYYKTQNSENCYTEFIFEYSEDFFIETKKECNIHNCYNVVRTIRTYDKKYIEQQFLKSTSTEPYQTSVEKFDEFDRCIYSHCFYGIDSTDYKKNYEESFFEYNENSELINCKRIIRETVYNCNVRIS